MGYLGELERIIGGVGGGGGEGGEGGREGGGGEGGGVGVKEAEVLGKDTEKNG